MSEEFKLDSNTKEYELGSKINGQIVATTAFLNDAWRNQMITLNLPNLVFNKLWLETAYFGSYILQKKFSEPLEKEKSKLLNQYMRYGFLLLVPTIFGEKLGDSELKKFVSEQYDDRLEKYRNFNGVDTRTLFCDLVKNVFNSTENCKIKFIDNTFGNRLKLKTALILGAIGGNKEFVDKHKDEVFLSDKDLLKLADNATQAFMNVNLDA